MKCLVKRHVTPRSCEVLVLLSKISRVVSGLWFNFDRVCVSEVGCMLNYRYTYKGGIDMKKIILLLLVATFASCVTKTTNNTNIKKPASTIEDDARWY